MIQGKYVKPDHTVRLKELIVSGDIVDKTDIAIYDRQGKFLTRGKWYEDKVLDYTDRWGKAKDSSGACVEFRLI